MVCSAEAEQREAEEEQGADDVGGESESEDGEPGFEGGGGGTGSTRKGFEVISGDFAWAREIVMDGARGSAIGCGLRHLQRLRREKRRSLGCSLFTTYIFGPPSMI